MHRSSENKAVVLLSGGLDSATALAIARDEGKRCHALSVAYGQRHGVEIEAARRVSASLGAADHTVVSVDLRAIGGSSLTGPIEVRKDEPAPDEIPSTYVPARNMIMLAIAAAHAEVAGAHEIVIGVNAVDYSGYPDCREEFIRAMEAAARLGTKAGVEGHELRIRTPLIAMSKAEIIRTGARLGVDYGLTTSCYDPGPDGGACASCHSCRIRRRGFEEAGIPDPTRYSAEPVR